MSHGDTARRKIVVGFTVHEAKELNKDGVAIDPLVIVRAAGREFKTQMKTGKIQHAKFEEGHIWNDMYLTDDEFNMSFIDFELQAANVFTRNDVIGSARVQLAMVRKRANHTVAGKWLQLTNAHESTARLRATVFCYGEGDAPPTVKEVTNCAEEAEEHIRDLKNAVLDTVGRKDQGQQSGQNYHLFVQVHRAEDLGGGDKLYNPYVTVEFNGHRLSSQHVVDASKLNFEEQFRLPVQTPLLADAIVIRVWSKNKWGADDIIVQGRLSFSLVRMHAMPPQWFTFYGFSSKEVPDVEQICSMGEVVEENTYLGRLLISAHVAKVKHGSLLKAATLQGGAFEEPASAQMTLLADVYEISGVDGSQAYVTMSLGKTCKKTKTVTREEDELSFNLAEGDAGRMPLLVGVVPVDPKNQVDVILSLHVKTSFNMLGISEDGFQRVGFVRLKLSEIRDWEGDSHIPKWVAMRPMVHLPSSVKPGAVLLTLSKTSKAAVKDRVKPTFKKLSFQLRCYLCAARGLNNQTEEMPKAFCEVSCAGQVARTQTADDPPTSAPRWAECLTIPIELQYSVQHSRVYPEPIQLVVYDDVQGASSAYDKLAIAVDAAKEVAQSEDALKELQNRGQAAVNGIENQEEIGVKLKRGALEMFGAIQDTVGAMGGDVMAKKRMGAIVDGRRVMGRANIHFNHIIKPPHRKGITPMWIKLKGGMMGSNHAGDILVGFEMLKPKYASRAQCNDPILPKKATPPGARQCVISVAVAGLRGVKVPEGYGALEKPKLEIAMAKFRKEEKSEKDDKDDKAGEEEEENEANEQGAAKATPKAKGKTKEKSKDKNKDAGTEKIKFTRKPPEGQEVSKDDYNRKWTTRGVSGWEFLRVVHLPALIPNVAVWEPDLKIRLLDEKDRLVAEGRASIADRLPWDNTQGKRTRALRSVQSQDDWPPDPELEEDGGIPVSDEEDDANYKTVEFGAEPLQMRFNDSDTKTFPPVLEALAKSSAARRAGVKAGDWLVGYTKPKEKDKPTGHWTQAQAAAFIQSMEEEKVRPLTLRFRRKGRDEVSVRLTENSQKTMLDFESDESVRPPKIEKDRTADHWWTKQGVKKGWRIVDINGFDCRAWHGNHEFFKKLLEMRPIIVTCRDAKPANAAAERELQLRAKVMLSGVPSSYVKAHEHKMRHVDQTLDGTLVPRCTPILPPVSDSKAMNLWPARDGCLDVQGKAVPVSQGDGDGSDERSRPTVEGKLEDSMTKPEFEAVPLFNGNYQVGVLKLAYTVKNPVPFDLNWVSNPKHNQDKWEKEVFDEKKLRRRFKVGQPAKLRVRTYITRGLSVSGAVQGVGNPFLYFSYGSDTVKLEGRRKMNTSEPRFFTTEERDIQLPDEALFEVGLYDWQEYGTPQLIGKTLMDLEDRWFTEDYQEYMKKHQVPIEYRPLLSGDVGSLCKGSLEMWVELLDSQEAAEVRKSPLFQPPPVEVEMRVIVWGVRNMSLRLCVDEFGDERGRVDVLARCALSCSAFLGPQPDAQETDIHYSSEGEAEFNWRFVYSKIAVTRGVPLQCHLQLSMWEHFALKRPVLLCENLMDMKNYCTRVAKTRDVFEIESEVPLTNRMLTKLLQDEAEENKWDAAENGGDSSEDEAFELKQHGAAEKQTAAGGEEVPVAALVKILVQVLPQTEASDENNKVGMKRDNPNRNPVLAYPKTGRNWQYALPTAVNVIEGIIDGYNTGKRRLCYTSIVVAIILVIAMLHYIKDAKTGCPYIMASCKSMSTCAVCACCYHRNEDASKFCYYSFLGSSKCGADPLRGFCNMPTSDCELTVTNGQCSPTDQASGGSCFSEPNDAVATAAATR